MFSNFIKMNLLVYLSLMTQVSFAGYAVQYNQITAATNVTVRTLAEISDYNKALQEKLTFFKQSCQLQIEMPNLQSCLNTTAFINQRMKRIHDRLSYLKTYVQTYPAELSGSRDNLEVQIQKIQESILKSQTNLQNVSGALNQKISSALNEKIQTLIVNNTLKGRAIYYCTSFNSTIDLVEAQYDAFESEKYDFLKYFLKYNYLVKFINSAKLFKQECPEKMNFKKANDVLQKYLDQVNEKNAITFLKTECPKLPNQDLKNKCLSRGEKKIDLIFSVNFLRTGE